jgi:hypothetical protein
MISAEYCAIYLEQNGFIDPEQTDKVTSGLTEEIRWLSSCTDAEAKLNSQPAASYATGADARCNLSDKNLMEECAAYLAQFGHIREEEMDDFVSALLAGKVCRSETREKYRDGQHQDYDAADYSSEHEQDYDAAAYSSEHEQDYDAADYFGEYENNYDATDQDNSYFSEHDDDTPMIPQEIVGSILTQDADADTDYYDDGVIYVEHDPCDLREQQDKDRNAPYDEYEQADDNADENENTDEKDEDKHDPCDLREQQHKDRHASYDECNQADDNVDEDEDADGEYDDEYASWDLTEQQDFYQFNDEYHVCTEDDRFTEDEDEDEDENAKYIKDGTDEC